MKTNIGLSDKSRNGSIEILSRLLSDEFLLYVKTRNYHWNVAGPDFFELHKFFEGQYEKLDEVMDEVAERARALAGKSLGTMKEFLAQTRLKEQAEDHPKGKEMIANLLADHEAIIVCLRQDLVTCSEKYQDAGTSDFLTGLMEEHEKMAWMLRAYLS